MGNAFVFEKVSLALIVMLWALVVWSIYESATFKQKCVDAGGISVSDICINPVAIIEVD